MCSLSTDPLFGNHHSRPLTHWKQRCPCGRWSRENDHPGWNSHSGLGTACLDRTTSSILIGNSSHHYHILRIPQIRPCHIQLRNTCRQVRSRRPWQGWTIRWCWWVRPSSSGWRSDRRSELWGICRRRPLPRPSALGGSPGVTRGSRDPLTTPPSLLLSIEGI